MHHSAKFRVGLKMSIHATFLGMFDVLTSLMGVISTKTPKGTPVREKKTYDV